MVSTHGLSLAALFAALTALGALLSFPIPLSPVPVTLQTLFIYLAGLILGSRFAVLSQVIYVALRLSGLSQPTGAAPGVAALFGPTGGFIVGFIFLGLVVGMLSGDRSRLTFRRAVIACTIGTAVLYLLGAVQLSNFFITNSHLDFQSAVVRAANTGLLLFIPGDILKVIAASLIASRPQVRAAVGKL